jgi:hypothetical protein
MLVHQISITCMHSSRAMHLVGPQKLETKKTSGDLQKQARKLPAAYLYCLAQGYRRSCAGHEQALAVHAQPRVHRWFHHHWRRCVWSRAGERAHQPSYYVLSWKARPYHGACSQMLRQHMCQPARLLDLHFHSIQKNRSRNSPKSCGTRLSPTHSVMRDAVDRASRPIYSSAGCH